MFNKLKKILQGRRKVKTVYLYLIYNYIIITIFLVIYLTTWKKINTFLRNRRIEIIYWPRVDANIQCYKKVHNDALKSIEDPHFSPKTKSIFFHETSCRGGLDSRQACAVESAASAHPDWDVYVLFTSPVTEVMLKRSCLAKLLQYPNIKLSRIRVSNYSANTPVSRIINHKIWKTEKAVQQTQDIMKMLTLNKWGGVSLDLDVLVMKSFNDLPNNWIAKESSYFIASGVMRFSKDDIGRNFTSKVLRQIASTYNPDQWTTNGASAIEKVLMRRCKRAVKSTGYCRVQNPLSTLLEASGLGYRLRSGDQVISHLLYMGDLKPFAPNNLQLLKLLKITEAFSNAIIGVYKCAVIHVKRGITIFDKDLFYPVHLWDSGTLVSNKKWPAGLLTKQEGEKPYTYNMWNIWTSLVKVPQNSAFVYLAQKVCPSIYKMYGTEFGV